MEFLFHSRYEVLSRTQEKMERYIDERRNTTFKCSHLLHLNEPFRKQTVSPPLLALASDRSTSPRPAKQTAAPKNCHGEYRVPKTNHVRSITQAIVQQSSIVTLVIEEYWYALFTAIRLKEVNFIFWIIMAILKF